MVSTYLPLRLVGLFPTPVIHVLHIENQAPCLFLKVQVIFYLSEAYMFLNHAVYCVPQHGEHLWHQCSLTSELRYELFLLTSEL
jgi:hypothetical protein